MKKLIFTLIFLLAPFLVYAHGDTADEVTRGSEIRQRLQTKEISCEKLVDKDFDVLGEYFMQQMLGDTHEAMNNMMEVMMGEEGENQMHVVLGKRLSNCSAVAIYGGAGLGFMPMMQMMMGYAPTTTGSWQFFAQFNFITYLLIWIVLVLIIAALLKWLFKK